MPQGFNWKLDVSLIAGVGAKEIVASTIGVLYSGDDSFGDDEDFSDDTEKYTHLRQAMVKEGITPLSSYAYLIFILLYFPCVATIAAIKDGSLHVFDTSTFTVDGNATLLAVGNANVKDEAPYYDTTHQVWHGRALAVIRNNGRSGKSTLRVSAEGLPSTQITFR